MSTAARGLCAFIVLLVGEVSLPQVLRAQQREEEPPHPSARLEPANPLELRAAVDSNSPAVWMVVDGQPTLHVFASSVVPQRLTGGALGRLGEAEPVQFPGRRQGGHWIESILPDVDGKLYGFYHHEPNDAGCGPETRTRPSIGMAVSRDEGLSWVDLGPILASLGLACETANKYFAGGVGDFSVLLGQDQYVYLFFTSYDLAAERQGVSLARLQWADRDRPQGTLEIWSDGAWRISRDSWLGRTPLLQSPLWPNDGSWHEGETLGAFWGPSVHWNAYLQSYVMLLNRAGDHLWNQEGIYISYGTSLSDPSTWTTPVRLAEGGRWYPQVIGAAIGIGTDRLAGQRARFFMSGTSDQVIVFTRP